MSRDLGSDMSRNFWGLTPMDILITLTSPLFLGFVFFFLGSNSIFIMSIGKHLSRYQLNYIGIL